MPSPLQYIHIREKLYLTRVTLRVLKIVIYLSRYIKILLPKLKDFRVGLYRIFFIMVLSVVFCELFKAETLFCLHILSI